MAPVFLFCHKKSYLCTLSHYRVIRMNHVDTIWREWLPPRTGGTACSATPKGGGGSLSARHNSLSFMAQAAVKKSDSAGIFLNKYLEIRENRVNTHTGAHASRYCKSFNLQRVSGIFPLPASDIYQRKSSDTYRISATRQRAGGHTSYTPVTYGARQCRACMCPGLFVSNRDK